VLDGRDVVYLLRRVPNVHLVSNVQIGSRLPAHVVNAGRIILAYLPVERVRAIFEGVQLERFTQQTPTHLDGLLAQIHRDNQLGLAWSDSSFEAGISSVAAPIFNHLNEVVASINVTGPTVSFDTTTTRRTDIAATVLRAAREISKQLGHGAIPHQAGKPMD
jgi:DNA-binding IclR family transcriptional regulator